jgi:hypothetical protein
MPALDAEVGIDDDFPLGEFKTRRSSAINPPSLMHAFSIRWLKGVLLYMAEEGLFRPSMVGHDFR